MRQLSIALLATSLLTLSGCAAMQAADETHNARVAAIHAAAGDEVNSFSRLVESALYSWEDVSDHEVLVYTRPNTAYLLDVGHCPALDYAIGIGVTSHLGQVSVMYDSVLVQDSDWPCRIRSIRPVDTAKLKQVAEAREGGSIVAEPAEANG